MSDIAAAYKLRIICSWIDEGDVTVAKIRERLETAIQELVAIQRANHPDEDPAADDSSLTPDSTVMARNRQIVADRQAEHDKKVAREERDDAVLREFREKHKYDPEEE